ncbi:MAG: hypothetical protein KDJ73_08975 [Notoacmeibacter sp.]|nr:hypothetical protein [Notoacmeibacter sp.]MCC0031710.1 hypothetical protein [Brucellaceae bacterium]
MIRLVTIAALLLASFAAHAAEITLVSYRYSKARPVPHIRLTGVIRPGDEETFAKVMQLAKSCANCGRDDGGPWAVVSLASPGGHYKTGIALADAFRGSIAATVVEGGDTCLSACAVAFLGGSGFWPTGGIGVFIDRTIEPGAKVGWHSPLFPDEVVASITDGGQAKLALDTTRIGISSMVQVLTKYNVSPLVIDKIIAMGEGETWNADTAGSLFEVRANLPDFPSNSLDIPFEEQLRNACARLAAYHYNSSLEDGMKAVSGPVETLNTTDTQGKTLTGINIDDRPLNVAACGTNPDGRDGNTLLVAILYRLDGKGEGNLELAKQLSNAVDGGWSFVGYDGGDATRSVLFLGTLAQALLPPDFPLASLQPLVSAAIDEGKAVDGAAILPTLKRDLGLTTLSETAFARVQAGEGMIIAEQVGRADLADELINDKTGGLDLTYSKDFANALVRSGNDTENGTSFYWMAIRAGARAAAIRIEMPVPGDKLTPVQKKLIAAYACSVDFEGRHLPCYEK